MLLKCYTTEQAALHSITSDLLDLLKTFACRLQYGIPFPSDSWCVGYGFLGTEQGSNSSLFCGAEVGTSSYKPLRQQQPRLTDRPGSKEGSWGQINQGSNPVSGLKRPSCCTDLSGPVAKFKVIVKAWTEGLVFWAIAVLELDLAFVVSCTTQYQCCTGLTPSSLPCSSAWGHHLAFFLKANLEDLGNKEHFI